MTNRTDTSVPSYSYEYYLDYLDLVPVDERKLKVNKHLVVVAFWVGLAAFVVLLFLILLYMSWSGSPQGRNQPQLHQTCCGDRSSTPALGLETPHAPEGAPGSSQVEDQGSRGSSAPDQRLEGGPASPSRPTCSALGLGPQEGLPRPQQISGIKAWGLPEAEPLHGSIDTRKLHSELSQLVNENQLDTHLPFSMPISMELKAQLDQE